jgi:hypothetical protein
VRAAIDTDPWEPAFKGNTDLFHGNLLYALAMFLDSCGSQIDPGLRNRIVETLMKRGSATHQWFVGREPRLQRYTQNHFYIPIGGLLCAALVLRREHPEAETWIATVRPYLDLMFDALGDDGWFFEGTDYFHYAFIWIVRLAELSERHFGLRIADKPCFRKLKDFLRWTYFPRGYWQFAVGDASGKAWNFSRWTEAESGQLLAPDNRLQNFAHVLYWRGDEESRALADEIKARSNVRRQEGFWCLAWRAQKDPLPASARVGEGPPCDAFHFFEDFGVYVADRTIDNSHTLRVLTKCGPPMGRSAWRDNQLVHQFDAGHVHPDAGSVWAAIDDVPILLGPGYLGRKSTGYQNTLTFDGRGQQDDRVYHALNPDAVDYARLMNLSITPDDARGVAMQFAAAYEQKLGILRANRNVRLDSSDALFTVQDDVETTSPRFVEARYRISDPPIERGEGFVRWRVADKFTFELRLLESSSPLEIFVQIGEVITMNDSGRWGPFEAGDVNQRGWQLILRCRERVTRMTSTIAFKLIA